MEFGLDKLEGAFGRLRKLRQSQRIALLVAIAAAVVGSYVYLFYLPGRATLERLGAQQLELQRKLSEVSSVAANLPAFEAHLMELDVELKTALRQLPSSKELPGLLTDISSRGRDAGLEFKAFRPKEAVPREFYAEIPIEIEFNGGFHDIAHFFDALKDLPRIVNVADLLVTVEAATPLATRLNVKGTATTFQFLEKGAVPAAPVGPGKRAPAKATGGDA